MDIIGKGEPKIEELALALGLTKREGCLITQIFEGLSEGTVLTDPEGRTLWVNKAFSEITGYTAEEIQGRHLGFRKPSQGEVDADHCLWKTLKETQSWSGEALHGSKNGQLFRVWLRLSAVRNGAGKVTGYFGMLSDIREKNLATERLHHMAYHDPLTDLPNRHLFYDRLHQALAHSKRFHCAAALLSLDLDGFKCINDTRGHLFGDQVLLAISSRLRGCVRESDTLSRLGGDEFMVILTDLPDSKHAIQGATQVADKILLTLSEPLLIEGHKIAVSVSIGISLYPRDADTDNALIKNADIAMYRAKHRGRNSYLFYS